MATTFAFLKDVRPYKASWRVQVKVLHAWRQYLESTGETLEIVLSDELGKKIHCSVRKDLVSKYVNELQVGAWVFIETFSLNYASGQYRPTQHLYKMTFQTGTNIIPCEPKSDSNFLTLAKFSKIQSGEVNPYILVDAIGQIVTIGELENLEAKNKPTTKIEFEIRDETDERIACTLWGKFAEQVFNACQNSDGRIVVCILRFVKIKPFKGVMGLSNSFDVTQVHVNPPWNEVAVFTQRLPADGLRLSFRERQPRREMITVKDEDYLEFPRKTISQLKNSTEIGKVRLLCTLYAIDTDWAWYYISCRKCNRKVNHIHAGVNGVNNKGKKPRFWCDVCKTVVTNVVARFMLYTHVMDNTGEAKLLLFDSICSELIGETATSVLDGSVDEIVDPENLPDPVKNLIGKTFLFLVCVEQEHIWAGKEIFKVFKVLSKGGLLEEQLLEFSGDMVNAASMVSGDEAPLMLENSQETTDSITPSSKRVYALNGGTPDQSSSSKKLCIDPLDLGKSNPEFGDGGSISQVEEVTINDGDEKKKAATQSVKPTIKDGDEKHKADAQSTEPTIKDGDEKQEGQDGGGSVNNSLTKISKNLMGVKVKIEKK